MTLVSSDFEGWQWDAAAATRLWRTINHPNVRTPIMVGESAARWPVFPSVLDVPFAELGLSTPSATVAFVRSIASAAQACQAAGLVGFLHPWLVLWDGTKPVLSQVFSSREGDALDVRSMIEVATYVARRAPVSAELHELLEFERRRRLVRGADLTLADFAELP